MNLFFIILVIVHVLIWVFVLFAFLNKNTAEINLYYIIPIIYLFHTFLPFHIISESKHLIYPENTEDKVKSVENILIIPSIFYYIKDNLFKNSYCDPLGAQGMLILGAITSAYGLKYLK